jgi:mercuric transport protein
MQPGREISKSDMNKLIAAVALAAGLSTAAFAAPKTETLKVSGWHCAGCAVRTESALKDLKGVSTAAADKKKQQVTVTYDDASLTHADLEKAVADSGYTVEK